MYQVYKITCAINGKVYIGYTSKGADVRFQMHIDNARWKRKAALYDAIRAYGNEAFSVEVLDECADHAAACASEIKHIEANQCIIPHGYNMTRGGDGVPLHPEIIARAAEKKRGKFTASQAAAAEKRKGKPLSAEHRAKLSMSRKGVPKPDSWKIKMQAIREAKSLARLLAGHPPKKRKGGVRLSQEERSAIMREASLRRWAKEREMAANGSQDITWTPERREMRRSSATAQWTAEQKEAARRRALMYWESKQSCKDMPSMDGGAA